MRRRFSTDLFYYLQILFTPKYISLLLPLLLFSTGIKGQEIYLEIQGEDSLETATIQQIGYQEKHDAIKTMKLAAQQVKEELQHIGYINLQTDSLQKVNDSLYNSQFKLGRKYSAVKVYYDAEALPYKDINRLGLAGTSEYFILPFNQTEQILQELSVTIANRGRPFSTLSLTEILPNEEDQLEAHLQITYSDFRVVDSIVIKGYEKFPRSFIKHFSRIKTGQAFNKSELDKKTEELKSLDFVNISRNPEILFTKEQTILYMYLEKRNSNRFEGFLGFSTNEETGKFELDGDISLALKNNLNYGESLTIKYKNTGNDQQHFNAQAKLPFMFSSPLGLKLSLDLFKQDSSYTTTAQTAAITYQINSKLEMEAGYKFKSSNNLQGNTTVIGASFENFESNFATVGMEYLDRNTTNPLFPFKTNLNLILGVGKRSREGESDNQQSIEFAGEHIFELDERNSFLLANKTAVLFSENYLSNELFRFGGIHSVRGFEENSLRASLFSGIQTEYRFLLSPNLYAHTIIDYAHLENATNTEKTNFYGIGFGLGLETKAGLLKVAFANGKTDGESFKFEHTKVHISLQASF